MKAAGNDVKVNWIQEYYKAIDNGSEVVSSRVRQIYERLSHAIESPVAPYVFDAQRAERPIRFIETVCKHSKGKWARKPVILELWQKAAISALFGFVHYKTGARQYTRFDLFVARKNGKSTLAAGIGLYMLTADGEGGAEVYSVATKKDQARIIWQEAKSMAAQSPVLRGLVRRLVGEIAYDRTFSTFKALASESDTLDGLNTHCCFVDELHAIRDKNLVDVIVDSMTARSQPMLFVCTTMGTVRESVFDDTYEYDCKVLDGQFQDAHVLPIIYELDKDDDWQNESYWKKANPGLGTIKDIDKFRDKVQKALNKPNEIKNLLCKDFNRRQTSTETWLTFEQLHNPATFDPKTMGFSYGIGGADLSTTTDLTAAKLICMKPGDDHIYEVFCRFRFRGVRDMIAPYHDIIHLRKHFNADEFYGSSNRAALTDVMEIINTTDQGMVEAVKNSAVIKWILKFKNIIKPDDIKTQVREFGEQYLKSTAQGAGVVPADPRYDIEQVKTDSYVPNAPQLDRAKQRIYAYYGVNDAIVQRTYNEEGWNAWYESTIEPILMQLAQQMTAKFFSSKERAFGNRIVPESSSLMYAATATKLNLLSMVDRGAMTPNEWRHVMNLGPIEGGEKPIRRLDTITVDEGEPARDDIAAPLRRRAGHIRGLCVGIREH
ncbi:hypothetical protein AGMMS49992_24290 [Clostridia bacterium]|nr:hypothetical protein AGMMS49992_24290 [Clostridia bacterium]